jgi:hypothetical protein
MQLRLCTWHATELQGDGGAGCRWSLTDTHVHPSNAPFIQRLLVHVEAACSMRVGMWLLRNGLLVTWK